MNEEIRAYNGSQSEADMAICQKLAEVINDNLPGSEGKVWHAHPVWFLDGNPIVGYSKQKAGTRLMFWSGADFNEDDLKPSKSGKFKDASIVYNDVDEINADDLKRWLEKSQGIQWDYKNIIKHKGVLKRLR